MGDARWKPVPVHAGTFPDILNSEFARLDAKYTGCLPDLRGAETLLLGSDYSGESSGAPYLVLSFLMASLESWGHWEPQRLSIRQKHFSDSRRMSFKNLSDGQRKRALLPLLKAANHLTGLSFSLALNRKCETLFAACPPLDLGNRDFSDYRKWKPSVLEKAFLIIHALGVLLGGLAAPGQNILWFTDQDSIAANDERVRELTQLFAWITSQYLTFDLGHCRCGTSGCDDGSRQIEDFLAIPDLIAGALAEQMNCRNLAPRAFQSFLWMCRGDFTEKTREITWWFSDCNQPLKRMICVVDPAHDSSGHLISWFHFNDQKCDG